MPVTPDFQVFSFLFTTTADITGTNQRIRFIHNGNDAGGLHRNSRGFLLRRITLSFPGYGATRAAETPSPFPTVGRGAESAGGDD